MKLLKCFIIITTALFFSCYSLSAQDNTISKNRIYKTWIYLDNVPGRISGTLYEVGDSSILLSQPVPFKGYSAGDEYISEYYFKEISILKTRKINSIRNGVLIGSISGVAIGGILGAVEARTVMDGWDPFVSIVYFTIIGVPATVFGAGIGALLGAIKDRFPIDGNYETFNSYRGVFQHYSYVREYDYYATIFEHRCFIGYSFGPSFPMGAYVNIPPGEEGSGINRMGGGGTLTLGYRFKESLGISISNIYKSGSNSGDGMSTKWEAGGIIISPVFSIPVNDKLLLDLKPGIGYAGTDLLVNNEFTKPGNGLGINLSASLQYNISKRWSLLAEHRYLYSNQKFSGSEQRIFQSFSLDFGISYLFSKKSL